MPPKLLALLVAAGTAGAAALLSGCGPSGPDVFAEGEALEASGKLEEAARKLELTCGFAPAGEKCPAAAGRAAAARLKAAEKAIADKQFVVAERLFGEALFTADDATAQTIAARAASEELIQGLAYERGLGRGDKASVAVGMAEIAKTKTAAAALAQAWIERERPGLAVAAAKAACGPMHEGSCSKAAAELVASGARGPEADEAAALAEAEARRVYPIRVQAELILASLFTFQQREDLLSNCEMPGMAAWTLCEEKGGHNTTPADAPDARIQRRRGLEASWLKAVREIADPELTAAPAARKSRGEGGVLDIPKPPPAPEKK